MQMKEDNQTVVSPPIQIYPKKCIYLRKKRKHAKKSANPLVFPRVPREKTRADLLIFLRAYVFFSGKFPFPRINL